jgi:ABC-type lipoprotein release transport system permease subunit
MHTASNKGTGRMGHDRFAYGAIGTLLALIALGATWTPARRAARRDRIRALRQE